MRQYASQVGLQFKLYVAGLSWSVLCMRFPVCACVRRVAVVRVRACDCKPRCGFDTQVLTPESVCCDL